ncbi:MAG: PD-(D/E)XK nuclease family protein [Bacilli bacterium]|nr:PD-(D/E)XK nuclease family protein [Bacilli bacterium]
MESKIKDTLEFIQKVINEEQNNYQYLFEFIKRYTGLYRKLEHNLPYHINVIDELHANENAHSRILTKLLQQKTTYNRFEILESFIEYLTEQKLSFSKNIKIENPIITQENGRIDLWIRDKTYSIIVENKIHYAPDQERQLERYIEKTREKGFRDEQIYVIYLSPQAEEPNEQSWGDCKDNFQDRYLNLSFCDNILEWLKEKVLPNIRLRDLFLKSAIEQYIDHLEGMFELRTINNKMNMELKEFIKQELQLGSNSIENIKILEAKREDIDNAKNLIQQLINEYSLKEDKIFFEKAQREMSEKYPELEKVGDGEKIMGFIVPLEDSISIRVIISYNDRLFCQVDMDIFEGQTLPNNVMEKTNVLLPLKNNNNQIWQYFDRFDYEGALKCFQEVMKILIPE